MVKAIQITEKVLNYIDKNKQAFENPTPELGETWLVTKETTYPVACNGEPVVEVENNEEHWMRLPADIVEVFELHPKFYNEFKCLKKFAFDLVNKKQSAGLINLSFGGKRVFPNEEKGTVAVETVSFIYPKVNHLKHLDVYGFDPLNTVGVAKVAPGDKFDEKR